MMTVITRVTLKQGSEPEWDAVMHERLAAAKARRGWVGGQLLMPIGTFDQRMIVGTWETRADWEAWHEDEAFRATRERLERLQVEGSETTWHEVLEDVRASAGA